MDRTTQKHHDDDEAPNPTEDTYHGFYTAFDYFNSILFQNMLPNCLITMQRKSGSRGYFAKERFGHRRGTGVTDEIALNPATFDGRTDREIISTLVHEMAHLWQFHFGKFSGGYHKKEWGAKMIELGLMPSHTGKPGGKQTGYKVTHYIIDGGPYDKKWKMLSKSGYTLDYQDRHVKRPDEPRKLKVKYTWPSCSIHAWGKPDLRITCTACKRPMK